MASIVIRDRKTWRYDIVEPNMVRFRSSKLAAAMRGFNVHRPFYTISQEGVFAERGYAWDGATGVLRQTENLRIPSLVHDIGCQAVNTGALPRRFRPLFDYEYYLQSRLYGVSEFRAQLHYAAISLWGMFPKTEPLTPKFTKLYTVNIRGV